MIGKVIKWIAIAAVIYFVLSHFGLIGVIEEASAQQNDFKDSIGPTSIDGHSTTDQTTFKFDIRSRIIHSNITLILNSERENSTYEVQVGQFNETGNFSYRKELNFELAEGPKTFSIIIDGYQYRFRRTISKQAMPGGYQDEIRRAEGEYYTDSQISSLKRSVWAQVIAAVGIAMPPSYFIAKKKKEGEITEVIE